MCSGIFDVGEDLPFRQQFWVIHWELEGRLVSFSFRLLLRLGVARSVSSCRALSSHVFWIISIEHISLNI